MNERGGAATKFKPEAPAKLLANQTSLALQASIKNRRSTTRKSRGVVRPVQNAACAPSTNALWDAMSHNTAVCSLHNGGVHALFVDGHVKFVSNTINLATCQALGTRKGGEVVSEF